MLRAYLWPERRTLVILVGALALGAALPLVGPILLGRFVDRAAGGATTGELIAIASAYLAVALGGQATTVLTTWIASREAWSSTNRLREVLADHALRLDISFHGHHAPGELIERVDGDVYAMAQFFVTFLVDVLGSALLLGGTIVVLTLADVRLGVALTVFVAVVGTLLVRVQRHAIPTSTAARESEARLFGDLEEQLGMAEDLRANGAGHHIVRRHHEVSAVAFRANRRAHMVGGALIRLVNIAFTIGTVLLLALGVALLRADAISLGTTLVLFQYSQLIRRPLERIIDQLKEMQAAQAGAARAAQLLALQPTIPEPADGGRPLPDGPLSVELRGVTFAYGDEDDVLHDVDLHVSAGRSLGLVGRTGSGKTTIGRLVLRLHDPTEGTVLVGGVDLRDVAFADLRSRVAVVTQEVQLFGATVRENVTLFRDGLASDDAIAEVLGELGLGPWLDALPHGLDTHLGPGGAGLSAGEAQLLAFARAFVADPSVVVLDEASSRLDPATESLLERAIDRLLEGRTAIVIAHRLASLDRMDEIAVVDDGRIVEHGARSDLAADATSRFAQLLEAAR